MIGIFDSGVGGLTVVREVFNILPSYRIIYLGDTARTPYGTKSPQTIIKYAQQDTEFLIKQGVKLIIIACNTVSAVAYNFLKDKYSLPIFEVITPAVEKALKISKNLRIGVIGTLATVNSQIYSRLIKEKNPKAQVLSRACPLLVSLIEENWIKKPEIKSITKKYLAYLKTQNIDTLILGCTHYPIIKDLIQAKIGQRVNLINSSKEVVLKVKEFLAHNPKIEKTLKKDKNHKFYLTDLTPKYYFLAQRLLKKIYKPEKIELS